MTPYALFITVFLTIFIAEMGDKTQLLLVAMAGKYKISHILIGTWLATALLNLAAVAAGAALSRYMDMRIIKSVAAAAFFCFAFSALRGDSDGEENETVSKKRLSPVFAIFVSFFIGELGDKTQLSAVTLAANYANGVFSDSVIIFAGCTLGLILADLIGLIVGALLKSKMPTGFLSILSFLIFAAFGAVNMWEASRMIFERTLYAAALCGAVCAVFAAVCIIYLLKAVKKRRAENSSRQL